MDGMDLVFIGAIAVFWLVAYASIVGCVKLGERT